jgi:hypothetical protein
VTSARLAVGIALVIGPLPLTAMAAPSSPAMDGGDEAEDLARSIASQSQSLSTDDCTAACQALGSMRRAADRLCGIDPGRRCTDARATVDSAARRVREACPTCAIASAPTAPASELDQAKASPAVAAQAPPRAERPMGGCGGCVAGNGAGGSFGAALAIAWLLARRVRRRGQP